MPAIRCTSGECQNCKVRRRAIRGQTLDGFTLETCTPCDYLFAGNMGSVVRISSPATADAAWAMENAFSQPGSAPRKPGRSARAATLAALIERFGE